DGEHVAGREHEVLLATELHLGPAVLAVEDDVALLDVKRDALLAVLVPVTRADREYLALLRLLLGGVRDHQAGSGGLLGLKRLDHDAVAKRLNGNLGGGRRHDRTSPSDLDDSAEEATSGLPSRVSDLSRRIGTLKGRVPTRNSMQVCRDSQHEPRRRSDGM